MENLLLTPITKVKSPIVYELFKKTTKGLTLPTSFPSPQMVNSDQILI